MNILPRWGKRPTILAADNSRGPWGGGGEDDGGAEGPRNPWSMPPAGRKGAGRPTALDEFLKKARA